MNLLKSDRRNGLKVEYDEYYDDMIPYDTDDRVPDSRPG